MTKLIMHADKPILEEADAKNIVRIQALIEQDTDESFAEVNDFLAENPWLTFKEVRDEDYERIIKSEASDSIEMVEVEDL